MARAAGERASRGRAGASADDEPARVRGMEPNGGGGMRPDEARVGTGAAAEVRGFALADIRASTRDGRVEDHARAIVSEAIAHAADERLEVEAAPETARKARW